MTLSGYIDSDGFPILVVLDPAPAAVVAPWAPRTLAFVPLPTPADLAAFLNWPPLDDEMQAAAQAHLDRARMLILSYTRWRGLDGEHLAEELAAVLLSVAGRLLSNPTNAKRIEAGQFNEMPGPDGFLLHELLTLDGWRRRAC